MNELEEFARFIAALKEVGLTADQSRGVRDLTGKPDGWISDVMDRAEEMNAAAEAGVPPSLTEETYQL
jgi:hypothetical protein